MLNKLFLTFAMLLSLSAYADEPYSFKGWRLGAKASELDLSRLDCSPGDGVVADKKCHAYKKETIAGKPSTLVMMLFYDDVLTEVAVVFDQKDYASVMDSMVEKFGHPSQINKDPVTTRAGVSYDNTVAKWKNSVSSIEIEQRSGKIDQSRVKFALDSRIEEFEKRSKKRAATGSHDI